jgi:hypothetical protein
LRWYAAKAPMTSQTTRITEPILMLPSGVRPPDHPDEWREP